MKSFEMPKFELVRFNNNVIATSTICGCFDAEWCPSDYKNCTADGAQCTCEQVEGGNCW